MSHDSSPSLVKGFSWTLVGNLVAAACQMGILVVLANFGDTRMTGEYGLASALVVPILTLANLQIRGLQATDGRGDYLFSEYLGMRLVSLLIAIPLIAVNIAWQSPTAVVAVVASILAVRLAVFAVSDVYYGLFQQKEKLDVVAKANIVTSVSSLAAFALGLIVTGDLIPAVIALAVVSAVPLAVHNMPSARKLASIPGERFSTRPAFSGDRLISLFWLALPLGIVSFLISLNANIPRYFLADSVGLTELGIFFGLVSLVSMADKFAAALAQAVSPRLAKLFATGLKSGFVRLLLQLEMLAAASGMVALVLVLAIGSQVVSFIYSPEYAAFPNALVLLTLSAALSLMSRFVGNAITVARRLKSQLVTNLLCVGALVLGCWALIPHYGIDGAAAAVCISSAVRLLFNTFILWLFLREWQPNGKFGAPEMTSILR